MRCSPTSRLIRSIRRVTARLGGLAVGADRRSGGALSVIFVDLRLCRLAVGRLRFNHLGVALLGGDEAVIAQVASFIAAAIFTGSLAWAMALFISTASSPKMSTNRAFVHSYVPEIVAVPVRGLNVPVGSTVSPSTGAGRLTSTCAA